MNKFDCLYNELVQISKEILPYYDIDKIKSYSVYIWTKGDDGENVFDILADEIVVYAEDHKIIEEAKPIIEKIQSKLKEIRKCSQFMNFISEDNTVITLPVPLGTQVYEFRTACNDACTFQKNIFNKTIRNENFKGCSRELPCHTKVHSIRPITVSLKNIEQVLTDWNVFIFKTEEEANNAGLKFIENHKEELVKLGLNIE